LSGSFIPATLNPASAIYASQAVGTASPAKTFTLTNRQTAALANIAISTTGDFQVSATTCGTSLAARSSCTISVAFTPTAAGTRTGTLSVTDSASVNPETSNLEGIGFVPATLNPPSHTYATRAVGTTSPPIAFTLINRQSTALGDIAISTTGDFQVSAATCGTSLAARGSCTISVTFTPTAAGTRTGALSVTDSAANSPQTVNLTGMGQ